VSLSDDGQPKAQAYADYATIPEIARELAERLGNYEFKLGHALRDLPSAVRFDILDEVRTGILDAIDHHIEMGMEPRQALSHVLGAYREPRALAREYKCGHGLRFDAAAVVDVGLLAACGAALVMHPFTIPALQSDGLSGYGVIACMALASSAGVVTRLPLRWARRIFTLTIERATVGYQVLGGLIIAQAVQASLSYNFASHDLILTLKHVSVRSLLVAAGMIAAERHRRCAASVRKARAFAYTPTAFLKEFFDHRFDRAASIKLKRSMEYFTQEDL
jgi:hypothetical protein